MVGVKSAPKTKLTAMFCLAVQIEIFSFGEQENE
jgi:hypothetical protein